MLLPIPEIKSPSQFLRACLNHIPEGRRPNELEAHIHLLHTTLTSRIKGLSTYRFKDIIQFTELKVSKKNIRNILDQPVLGIIAQAIIDSENKKSNPSTDDIVIRIQRLQSDIIQTASRFIRDEKTLQHYQGIKGFMSNCYYFSKDRRYVISKINQYLKKNQHTNIDELYQHIGQHKTGDIITLEILNFISRILFYQDSFKLYYNYYLKSITDSFFIAKIEQATHLLSAKNSQNFSCRLINYLLTQDDRATELTEWITHERNKKQISTLFLNEFNAALNTIEKSLSKSIPHKNTLKALLSRNSIDTTRLFLFINPEFTTALLSRNNDIAFLKNSYNLFVTAKLNKLTCLLSNQHVQILLFESNEISCLEWRASEENINDEVATFQEYFNITCDQFFISMQRFEMACQTNSPEKIEAFLKKHDALTNFLLNHDSLYFLKTYSNKLANFNHKAANSTSNFIRFATQHCSSNINHLIRSISMPHKAKSGIVYDNLDDCLARINQDPLQGEFTDELLQRLTNEEDDREYYANIYSLFMRHEHNIVSYSDNKENKHCKNIAANPYHLIAQPKPIRAGMSAQQLLSYK